MPEKQISPFILASASPRRRQLLAEAGYDFTVIPPEIDESVYSADRLEPSLFAEQLALVKAKSISEKHPDSLVIGADTIIDFQGKIIGKPTDAQDARRIVRMLFSSPHKVITGLAICRGRDGLEFVTHASTTVYPKPMTQMQIDEHIKSDSWKDKSGAYAIQENDDEFIEKIEGSLTNVMGLPMELLAQLIHKFAINK
jgi:septum formation protein